MPDRCGRPRQRGHRIPLAPGLGSRRRLPRGDVGRRLRLVGSDSPVPCRQPQIYPQPRSGRNLQEVLQGDWFDAATTDYVDFDLWVRAYEDTNGTKTLVSKNLGLLDAKISNPSTNTKSDISEAVRVAISNATDDKHVVLAAKSSSTTLHGELDLDNDGEADKEYGYSEEPGVTLQTLTYGSGAGTTYDLSTEAATLFCTESNNANNQDIISGGISLGKTGAAGVKLNVKIWLEGWQELGGSTLWNVANYVGATFFVGFTLASGY